MIDDHLVYDLGAHQGEDTAFYLKKGFKVVAVEAVPEFCAALAGRFAAQVAAGQLKILNLAIARDAGNVDFYIDTGNSVWGTTNPQWVARNKTLGSGRTRKISVRAERLADVMREHGVPRYCKIDIEGNDVEALASLQSLSEPPEFVSVESEKREWNGLVREFELLESLGYTRFKIIDQTHIRLQKPPQPAREGRFEAHTFEEGSSGLFGNELPGRWMDMFEALEAYKGIFRGYALAGDFGIFRRRSGLFRMLGSFQEFAVRATGRREYRFPEFPPAGWYDTHATR
jgi:FkbM family methyltransferase